MALQLMARLCNTIMPKGLDVTDVIKPIRPAAVHVHYDTAFWLNVLLLSAGYCGGILDEHAAVGVLLQNAACCYIVDGGPPDQS